MAALSSGREGVGVYLVSPESRAALAASLMNAGVSKSGSPAPKPTTSTPAFFSALALALTARGIDSDTRDIRSASGIMRVLRRTKFCGEKRYRDWRSRVKSLGEAWRRGEAHE